MLQKLLILPFVALLATACVSLEKEASEQDVALQDIRAELEDVKHQLHGVSMDVNIIEDKVNNRDEEFSSFQDQMAAGTQVQHRKLRGDFTDFENRLENFERFRESVQVDFRQLKDNVNELTKAFAKNQNALNVTEQNVGSIKSALETIMGAVQKGSTMTYKVQSGDSLEKISRKNNTTVQAIKELNGLDGDLIVIGQELRLPE